MIKCKKCSFDNYDGTHFCQSCGEMLGSEKGLSKVFQGANFNYWAGLGRKDSSFVPLMADTIEAQGKMVVRELGSTDTTNTPHPKVIPQKNGKWFCPECGEHNGSLDCYCKSCGRVK